MKAERITVNAFCVIGKVGSSEEGSDTVQRLWAEANADYAQVEGLAKKNADGVPVGFWGIMTRADMSFLPWEDDFTRGLYLAGAEVRDDAVPPTGWKKWIVPGFECLKVRVESPDTFRQTLAQMREEGLELAAAVQDFTDPVTQQSYMLFPIAWNDSKRELLRRFKESAEPVGFCGFHCGHCFLMEWCGNCRTACNACSYATIFPDNRCENEKCCTERGLHGCWDCPELMACEKGFFREPAGSIPKACALFIKRYGMETYDRSLDAEEKKGDGLREDHSVEENFRLLESFLTE